jgi:cytochrome c-type biogenesis protein CcmH
MTRLIAVFALMLGAFAVAPLAAQDGLPPAPYAYRQIADPAKEAQARDLMHTLRCLVCQGQSIADSDAPLAGDMRSQVRERIIAGESPDQIRDWLVARYGAWVTYEPPLGADTLLLYLAPVLALIGGGWIAFGRLRRKGDEA